MITVESYEKTRERTANLARDLAASLRLAASLAERWNEDRLNVYSHVQADVATLKTIDAEVGMTEAIRELVDAKHALRVAMRNPEPS